MNSGCVARTMAVCVALLLAFDAGRAPAQGYAKAEGKSGGLRVRTLTGVGPRALMQTPDSGSHNRGGPRSWVQIGVQFDTDIEWTDEVTFQFYALLRDTKGDYTLLKGSSVYVDVARGRGHMGTGFIRPAGLLRFGEVVGVAVEAVVRGETVSTKSEGKLDVHKPLPQEWWKLSKLTPKEGYIVDKSKTPFATMNYDDYEALK